MLIQRSAHTKLLMVKLSRISGRTATNILGNRGIALFNVHTRNDLLAAQNTIHPAEDRVFSIRELMAMMTIPDDFRWVDYSLDELNTLSDKEKRIIDSKLEGVPSETRSVLEKAGLVLSELTGCAAVSTTPADSQAVIRRVELVPIGTKTAMVVMLTSSGILKSRVCRTSSEITLDIVETFYNITKQHFIGKPAASLSIAKIQTVALSLGDKSFAMTPLLVTLADLASMTERTELLLEGQSNLLNYREFESNAYELMEFLRRSEPLSQVFKKYTEKKGTEDNPNVLIGRENLFRELQNSSMIFGEYKVGGRDSGTIGIIGPTRLDYSRLIPSLKYLTDIVSRILSHNIDD